MGSIFLGDKDTPVSLSKTPQLFFSPLLLPLLMLMAVIHSHTQSSTSQRGEENLKLSRTSQRASAPPPTNGFDVISAHPHPPLSFSAALSLCVCT